MRFDRDSLQSLLHTAMTAAREAGVYIQASASRQHEVLHKDAGSNIAAQVVTEVDLKADAMLRAALSSSCEEYDLALLTEESGDDRSRLIKDAFWCVDPLDGTLGFINARPGYSVSIALVANDGTPLIGVVYDPVADVMYSAVRGGGAFRQGDSWQPLNDARQNNAFTLVYDQGFDEREYYPWVMQGVNALAKARGFDEVQTLAGDGGVINALRVLEHSPACYFKFPKAQEGGGCLWDFAATAAIFNECGASASDYTGQPLALNRAESLFMNHRGVLYASNAELSDALRRLLPVELPDS